MFSLPLMIQDPIPSLLALEDLDREKSCNNVNIVKTTQCAEQFPLDETLSETKTIAHAADSKLRDQYISL